MVLSLLSMYVLLLLDLALLEFPSRHPVPNPIPLRSIIADWTVGGRGFVVNFLGNIVAFMPIGMIPSLARPRRAGVRSAALLSLSSSVLIEAVQFTTGRRVADVDDIILNTAGGLLGHYALSLLSSRRMASLPGESEQLAGEVAEHRGGPD